MVKTRPDVKRHTKNTVSTSTMFKKPSMKHKNEAIRAEDAALRFFGVEKSSKIEKANKGMKRNKQRKVKKQVEHPLAAAFSGRYSPHPFQVFLAN